MVELRDMPEISQRTLGKVIPALNELPSSARTTLELRNFWRTKLFKYGFPEWLCDFAQDQSLNWAVIIPELFAGEVRKDGYMVGGYLCQQQLPRLTVLALTESKNQAIKDSIRLSLQLDGFDIGKDGIRPIDGPISIDQEKSRLLDYLKKSKLGRQDIIS